MPTGKKKAQSTPLRRAGPKGSSSSKTIRKNQAVDAWFDSTNHPLKSLMLKVRRVVLASDSRVTESVKWSTPTFSYNGDIASFIPQAKAFVSLLFHRGAEIPGKHPRLEGDSRLARTMRFADAAELEKYTPDLQRVIRAWCDARTK
jgi:hypothetical protein